jgi:hypothetical protein
MTSGRDSQPTLRLEDLFKYSGKSQSAAVREHRDFCERLKADPGMLDRLYASVFSR